MKLKIYAVFVTLALAAAMLACGGSSSNNSTGGTTPALKKIAGAFGNRGFGGLNSSTTKTTTSGLRWNGSLVPSAYAQTTSTVTMTGVYHGTCTQATYQSAYPIELMVGEDQNKTCSSLGNYWGYSDAAGAVMSAVGQPAIGAGTLSNLVVYGQGSGNIHLWVQRAGGPVDTGVNCSLPGTDAITKVRCYDTTHTFALQDGDMVVYEIVLTATDVAPANVDAYVAKT